MSGKCNQKSSSMIISPKLNLLDELIERSKHTSSRLTRPTNVYVLVHSRGSYYHRHEYGNMKYKNVQYLSSFQWLLSGFSVASA